MSIFIMLLRWAASEVYLALQTFCGAAACLLGVLALSLWDFIRGRK